MLVAGAIRPVPLIGHILYIAAIQIPVLIIMVVDGGMGRSKLLLVGGQIFRLTENFWGGWMEWGLGEGLGTQRIGISRITGVRSVVSPSISHTHRRNLKYLHWMSLGENNSNLF